MTDKSFICFKKMTDRATRKKQITERRQSQILQAAGEVFARKGFTAATVPEIARLAGIASGTVYLYYPSKRDLFIAVIQQMLIAPLLHIFEQSGQLDFIDLLNGAINDRLSMMQRETFPRVLSFIGEIQRDEELRAMYAENLVKPFLSNMESYFRERQNTEEFRMKSPEIMVRLIGGTVIGIIILKALEGEASPFSQLAIGQAAVEIRDYILFGIKPVKGTQEETK